MTLAAVIGGAVFIGAAVGLMAALATLAEGFDERLEDLSWGANRVKEHVQINASRRTNL